MKVYTKPQMLTLSISANDMLCAGCDIATRNSTDPDIIAWTEWWGGTDGLLDPHDPVFGPETNCANVITKYCKFGPEGMQLFTS